MKNSRTKIIATIGPASKDRGVIGEMIDLGLDMARLNFSWGKLEEHQNFVETIREEAKNRGVAIPIIQDLSGPRAKSEEGHSFDESALSVITEKDKKDLEFAKKNNLEYVALSYVGSAEDIRELRSLLGSNDIKIIAKIERQKALDNFDEILKEADTIMIARGDLGQAIPLETMPFVQKELIQKCNKAGKEVIVATELMSSMVDEPDPSRADVSDVVSAVEEGADILMLSNETAVGKYPVEVVRYMEKIIQETESRQRD